MSDTVVFYTLLFFSFFVSLRDFPVGKSRRKYLRSEENGRNGAINRKIGRQNMSEYTYVTLRQKPELKEEAAAWFHDKWEVPQEAYLECMEAYLNKETEYEKRTNFMKSRRSDAGKNLHTCRINVCIWC